MQTRSSFFATLAEQSAAAWQALSAKMFHGDVTIETEGSLYRFVNSAFRGQARKADGVFEMAPTLVGRRLIGFVVDEGGFWSLSPRWVRGTQALLWKPQGEGSSFVVTSRTTTIDLRQGDTASAPSRRPRERLESRRNPMPASLTRLHLAAPIPAAEGTWR